jgi:hypothetical protein
MRSPREDVVEARNVDDNAQVIRQAMAVAQYRRWKVALGAQSRAPEGGCRSPRERRLVFAYESGLVAAGDHDLGH